MASEGKTVDIAGHKVSRTTAGVFALAAVGVIIVAVMRKHSAAGTAAAGTAAAAFTDPGGNVCAAPDPQTGYCPGTPQDISAQQQLAATSTASGLNTSVPDLVGGGGGGTSGLASSVPTFTDNGSWGQYVELALGSDGTDATAAAIAKYLNGSQLTDAQATTVEQAIAIANFPPVAGVGGAPPTLKTTAAAPAPPAAAPPAPAPPAPPAAVQVTVPKVTGMRANPAIAALEAAGLTWHLSETRNPVDEYEVDSQTPGAGAKVAKGSNVDLGITAL